MADLPEKYRFKDGVTDLSATVLNGIFGDIDQRLRRQEAIERDWLAATRDLITVGLGRINDVLVPAYERVQALAELGFLIASAEAVPGVSFTVGGGTLVVAAGGQRELFSPSPFVILTRSTTSAGWAVARKLSYDRVTGVLAYEIVSASGPAGPHADVIVAAVAGSTVAQIDLLAQATTARTDAQTARTGAEAARDTAVTSAGTATIKAGEANASSTAAANSAIAAGNSATAAGTSATNAAASAAAAAGSVGGVKVTVADTTPKQLDAAITVASPLTKAVISPGDNEKLHFALDQAAKPSMAQILWHQIFS